jgi:hydrogenase expression/formation protein HypD
VKYIDEFRDPKIARQILREIEQRVKHNWVIMEICGGQTHSIMKNGIDRLLPGQIELVHGPGCPVCVTPLAMIDQALVIAARPEVIFTSFGDMLRVPGSSGNLFTAKSQGADVRMVYSPLEALKLARENPQRQVVFFAVGFETTAPANAMAVAQAKREGLDNFSVLVSHVLVPPAMQAILASASNRVQGFLAAGHVCTVMGWAAYEEIATQYKIPIVATGFEPIDILQGILTLITMLENKQHGVKNEYKRAVNRNGNQHAQAVIADVFTIGDRDWRGIGTIPESGYHLRDAYKKFDAGEKFAVAHLQTKEADVCISGLILQGVSKPPQCPAFGKACTQEHPLGATMVSSEGACAAYFSYRRHELTES